MLVFFHQNNCVMPLAVQSHFFALAIGTHTLMKSVQVPKNGGKTFMKSQFNLYIDYYFFFRLTKKVIPRFGKPSSLQLKKSQIGSFCAFMLLCFLNHSFYKSVSKNH